MAVEPRDSALAVMREVAVAATGLVEYRSGGVLLIIGGEEAQQLLAELPPGTEAALLLSSGKVSRGDTRVIQAAGRAIGIQGYLGNFTIKVGDEADGLTLKSDILLDLSPQPLLTAELPPPGYLTPDLESTPIASLLEELQALSGTFDKPEYFRYDPDRCAHARNGVTACTRCIDSCPAEAIRGLVERVEVDPFICQGGGICAAVCPSGAIGYAYPSAGDLGARVRVLLRTFREAGGKDPLLLFHAGEALPQELLTQSPNLLPVAVEEVASVGLESWLSALAWGASRVLLTVAPETPDQVRQALETQLGLAWEILAGLGYPTSSLALFTGNRTLLTGEGAMPEIAPATHAAMEDKRTALYLALDHLNAQAECPRPMITLSVGAPFGAAFVEAACTLCMTCVSVCPGHALQDGQGNPQLRFIESNCIQCGLCTRTCPENAIWITPRLLFDRGVRTGIRVLYEEEPFCCVSCGKPFATRSVIDKMLGELSGHWMFQSERARQRLMMCDDCRVVDVVQDREAMQERDITRQ